VVCRTIAGMARVRSRASPSMPSVALS
jgi:hypothetical protein